MSTTFAIFEHESKLDGHGELKEEDMNIRHISCAFRSSYTRWTNGFDIISKHLPDSTPVYPLDNSPQGIYSIGDLKKIII